MEIFDTKKVQFILNYVGFFDIDTIYTNSKYDYTDRRVCPTYEIDLMITPREIWLNNKKYYLEKGDVNIRRPGDVLGEISNNCKCYAMYVSVKKPVDCPKNAKTVLDVLPPVIKMGHNAEFQNTFVHLTEIFFAKSEHSKLLSYSHMFLLISQIYDTVFNEDKSSYLRNYSIYVKKATRYIANNVTLPLKVEEIAKEVGLNSRYFQSIFKKETGVNPKEYILNIKLERISNFLKSKNDDIETLALMFGFTSSSHMSSAFKKHYGMTPAEFRKKHYID